MLEILKVFNLIQSQVTFSGCTSTFILRRCDSASIEQLRVFNSIPRSVYRHVQVPMYGNSYPRCVRKCHSTTFQVGFDNNFLELITL